MEWARFVLDVVRVIIWPVLAIVVLALIGKARLRSAFEGITEWSAFGLTAKRGIEQKAAELSEESERLIDGGSQPPSAVAEPDPELQPPRVGIQAINLAWDQLVEQLRLACTRVGVELPESRRSVTRTADGYRIEGSTSVNPAWMVQKLQAYGMPPLGTVVDGLRQIRSDLLVKRIAPTGETVDDFVSTTARVQAAVIRIGRDKRWKDPNPTL